MQARWWHLRELRVVVQNLEASSEQPVEDLPQLAQRPEVVRRRARFFGKIACLPFERQRGDGATERSD